MCTFPQDPACGQAVTEEILPVGVAATGQSCDTTEDCAPAPTGSPEGSQVWCQKYFTPGPTVEGGHDRPTVSAMGVCILRKPGALGDEDCEGTITMQGQWPSAFTQSFEGPTPEAFVCDEREGLHCNFRDGVRQCIAKSTAGGTCRINERDVNPCPIGYWCTDAQICVRRKSRGEACVDRSRGGAQRLGYGAMVSDCQDGLFCDVPEGAATGACVDLNTIGLPCKGSHQCASNNCVQGTCGSPVAGFSGGILCGSIIPLSL